MEIGYNLLRTSTTFSHKLRHFLSFKYIFKCNAGETNDKFINSWSFLSSDIIPTSSKEKESDELLYTIRSLVMVREPAAKCESLQQNVKASNFSVEGADIEKCNRDFLSKSQSNLIARSNMYLSTDF